MKMKLFLSMVAMFLLTLTATFASFPVQTASSNTQTTVSSEVSSPAAAGSGKSQLIAAILCFAIGGLGIHRFYLGYTWQGIVQILTAGGCGVWTLIDLIRILMGTLQPKDGSYAKTL